MYDEYDSVLLFAFFLCICLGPVRLDARRLNTRLYYIVREKESRGIDKERKEARVPRGKAQGSSRRTIPRTKQPEYGIARGISLTRNRVIPNNRNHTISDKPTVTESDASSNTLPASQRTSPMYVLCGFFEQTSRIRNIWGPGFPALNPSQLKHSYKSLHSTRKERKQITQTNSQGKHGI